MCTKVRLSNELAGQLPTRNELKHRVTRAELPDQAAYEREEQRRFEILDAHWDLPVKTLDLNK